MWAGKKIRSLLQAHPQLGLSSTMKVEEVMVTKRSWSPGTGKEERVQKAGTRFLHGWQCSGLYFQCPWLLGNYIFLTDLRILLYSNDNLPRYLRDCLKNLRSKDKPDEIEGQLQLTTLNCFGKSFCVTIETSLSQSLFWNQILISVYSTEAHSRPQITANAPYELNLYMHTISVTYSSFSCSGFARCCSTCPRQTSRPLGVLAVLR